MIGVVNGVMIDGMAGVALPSSILTRVYSIFVGAGAVKSRTVSGVKASGFQ